MNAEEIKELFSIVVNNFEDELELLKKEEIYLKLLKKDLNLNENKEIKSNQNDIYLSLNDIGISNNDLDNLNDNKDDVINDIEIIEEDFYLEPNTPKQQSDSNL